MGAQSSGPGKILHTLTDKATGQTHPQDSAGSSQNSYLPGGGGRYVPESRPQQQYGREHRADEYQQGHDVYGEGGYGGYQKSGGHQQIGNPDRGQHAEEYHQESGQSRYQQPKGYQQAGGHEQADGRGYEQ